MSDVAVVTGGAGGLGRLLTTALAHAQLHVVVADLDPAAGLQAVDEIQADGGSATYVETDASEAGQIRELIDQAASLGSLTTLVNNAGGWSSGPQFPRSDTWRRTLDLNLVMPMLATQLCLPVMAAAGGGAIVNVSSSGGWDSGAYGSPEYAAAKAGLVRFTTATRDFAPRFGVRVNCVVPHWIGLDRAVAEYAAMSPATRHTSGGLVDPHAVVRTVLHLVSDSDSSGRVVVLRPGRDPYDVDPATYDPVARAQPDHTEPS